MKIVLAFVLLSCTCFIGAEAKVYKWVDEHGVTHYSAKNPENGAEEMQVRGMKSRDSSASPASNGTSQTINCEQAVKHQIKLVTQELKKYNDELTISIISSPKAVKHGIKSCQQDMQNPTKAAVWACQAKASTADAMKACED